MPGISWMTPKQSVWMKTKVDGFSLSQLQGETTTFLSNTSCEWFEKWPEAAVHFKDSKTGIPLMSFQLSEKQTEELAQHLKQRCSKLRSYFYRSNSAAVQEWVTQFTKTVTKLMGSTTTHTCGPSAVEHFIQTEYKDNLTAMAAWGEEYVLKMQREAKAECELHAKKAKAEMEALSNPTDSAKLQLEQERVPWGTRPSFSTMARALLASTFMIHSQTIMHESLNHSLHFLKGAFAVPAQELMPYSSPSPSSINTIVPILDTSDVIAGPTATPGVLHALANQHLSLEPMPYSSLSPSSINTIVPILDPTNIITGPTATPGVLQISANLLFSFNSSHPDGIHPSFEDFLFHPVPIPNDSLNLSDNFLLNLLNEAIANFLARTQSYKFSTTAAAMNESPTLPPFPSADESHSPCNEGVASARIESKIPSGGIKKAPRPRPFRGGTDTRHDLYRSSTPLPSVLPAMPVTHPDPWLPAATEPPVETPLQATVAATHEAPTQSQATEPPAVIFEATVASPATLVSAPGAIVTSSHRVEVAGQLPDKEPMVVDENCAAAAVFMFHLLAQWKLTILALTTLEESHESHANWQAPSQPHGSSVEGYLRELET
ncbi:uncharacterized protein F5147DRAFT_652911 [Suillus discolor]|uniref:Uncharacterized protein n=1 Tax=Suillus discolor TaxID=1912936 RepID=A0A9P7JU99_9AGAM|nr:uncharacterized protein F5147DRAFT_652911 [Suillus discolor]KAG2108189.1 hypothetical protein F5147DRAFT_652911 [Suillus discolor]